MFRRRRKRRVRNGARGWSSGSYGFADFVGDLVESILDAIFLWK